MSAHNGLQERLLRVVEAKPGLGLRELVVEVAQDRPYVKQALYRLRKQGLLHTAGPEREWRYFSTAEQAAACHEKLCVEVAERKRLQELAQFRQANLRAKAKRAAAGKRSANRRSAAVPVVLPPDVKLAPDVKVTIAPPLRDRFAPEPGFERVITADYMLRRQGVSVQAGGAA